METVWLEKKSLLCFCGETETVTNSEKQRAIAKSNKGVLFFPSCGKMILTSYESSTSLISITKRWLCTLFIDIKIMSYEQ